MTKADLLKLATKFLPLLFILAFTGLLFRKIFTQGLFPYPGDLLVSFYYPWQNGGWKDYNPFVFHKEFLASDAIRQDIPWRFVAINQLKNGQLPLWNPYAFSGTPLLANMQSAVFYPVNLVFFVTSFFEAWIIYIILAPLLGSLGVYLYLRQLQCSRAASLFGGISFITSTFFLVWLEIGIVAHTVIWLPFMLWSVEKYEKTAQLRYWVLLIVWSVCALLAGHFQTGLHVFISVGLYWLVARIKSKKTLRRQRIGPLALWGICVVGLTAFQLLPTYELKQLSPLTEAFAKDVYQEIKTPWINLTTLFAPDYLGNPAFENFTSNIYGDGTPFVSALAVMLSLTAVYFSKKNWQVYFWAILGLMYILFGFPGPIYSLVGFLQIDLLTGTLASRALILLVFALTVLSSIGLDQIIKYASQKKLKVIGSIASIYMAVLGSLFLVALLDWRWQWHFWFTPAQAFFALKSIAIPVLISSLTFILLGLVTISKKAISIVYLWVVLSTGFYGLYQANRIMPFSPKSYFYPKHPVITQMETEVEYERVAGLAPTIFEKSFYPLYGLYSPEGYDSLRIKRYAELFGVQSSTDLRSGYSKSDADFTHDGTFNRSRLLNLTSVTHVFDKNEADLNKVNPEPYKFPHDTVELIWVLGKFRIYKRLDALPRFGFYDDYEVIEEKEAQLARLFDPTFNLHTHLLLETELNQDLGQLKQKELSIQHYQANSIALSTKTDADSLLLITDADYPGWRAFVDGVETSIHQANYAFRSILVPKGEHTIQFRYQPESFYYGLLISGSTVICLIVGILYGVILKRVKW